VVLKQSGTADHAGAIFLKDCKHHLRDLATRHNLPVGRFLVTQTPPLTLEKRGALMTEAEAASLSEPEKEEIIKVFVGDDPEPVSVVDVPHSIAHLCSNHFFQAFRLYLVPADDTDDAVVQQLRNEVRSW
jgi:hypothetical protein